MFLQPINDDNDDAYWQETHASELML